MTMQLSPHTFGDLVLEFFTQFVPHLGRITGIDSGLAL